MARTTDAELAFSVAATLYRPLVERKKLPTFVEVAKQIEESRKDPRTLEPVKRNRNSIARLATSALELGYLTVRVFPGGAGRRRPVMEAALGAYLGEIQEVLGLEVEVLGERQHHSVGAEGPKRGPRLRGLCQYLAESIALEDHALEPEGDGKDDHRGPSLLRNRLADPDVKVLGVTGGRTIGELCREVHVISAGAEDFDGKNWGRGEHDIFAVVALGPSLVDPYDEAVRQRDATVNAISLAESCSYGRDGASHRCRSVAFDLPVTQRRVCYSLPFDSSGSVVEFGARLVRDAAISTPLALDEHQHPGINVMSTEGERRDCHVDLLDETTRWTWRPPAHSSGVGSYKPDLVITGVSALDDDHRLVKWARLVLKGHGELEARAPRVRRIGQDKDGSKIIQFAERLAKLDDATKVAAELVGCEHYRPCAEFLQRLFFVPPPRTCGPKPHQKAQWSELEAEIRETIDQVADAMVRIPDRLVEAIPEFSLVVSGAEKALPTLHLLKQLANWARPPKVNLHIDSLTAKIMMEKGDVNQPL